MKAFSKLNFKENTRDHWFFDSFYIQKCIWAIASIQIIVDSTCVRFGSLFLVAFRLNLQHSEGHHSSLTNSNVNVKVKISSQLPTQLMDKMPAYQSNWGQVITHLMNLKCSFPKRTLRHLILWMGFPQPMGLTKLVRTQHISFWKKFTLCQALSQLSWQMLWAPALQARS